MRFDDHTRKIAPRLQHNILNLHFKYILVLSLFHLSVGYAQSVNYEGLVDVRRFSPTMDAQGFAVTERAVGLNTGEFNLGLMVDFGFDVLQERLNGRQQEVLDRYTTGQLSFAFGLWEYLTLAVSQPFLIIQGDLDGEGIEDPFAEDGLGDTRFLVKGVILNSKKRPLGVALLLETSFAFQPTHPLTSHGQSPLLTPSLIIDTEWRYVSTSLNVGYALKEDRSLTTPILLPDETTVLREDPLRLGPELIYRWGLSGHYIPDVFHQSLELIGVQPTGTANRGQSLELITALRLIFNKGSHLTVGIGHGLLDGYADLQWRAFMSITFHPTDLDQDGDGISDSKDQCPREKEDIDQFEDQDGCPDNDNDYDGITDLYDQCPNDPEDINEFEDQDGCPDGARDVDRDGIPDPVDECPGQPEDKDGFADQDGCPDEDNDRDTIPDSKDRCPNDSEDFDSFEDQDGCPDLDNDQDGIPDQRDQCPYEPEDKDGDADTDGCPDEEPKEAPKVQAKGGKLKIKGRVFFKTGKAIIKTESYSLLLEIAIFINQHPELGKIEVQGHTDNRGRVKMNQRLSSKRASAVRVFLIKQGSVDPKRLISKGYGSTQPVDLTNTPAAWAKNRRVDFKFVQREK